MTPSPSPSSLGEPSASNAATYDGTVVFHVYDSLEAPKPIFSTFLGALHVVEVARFHPNFVSAHFHYALKDGEQKIDAKTPNSCFNCTLLDDVAPDAAFEDSATSSASRDGTPESARTRAGVPRNRDVRPERRCRSVGVREDAREETRARRRGGRCADGVRCSVSTVERRPLRRRASECVGHRLDVAARLRRQRRGGARWFEHVPRCIFV